MPPSSPAELDPEQLHFLPIGVGNAFTRHHYNSSFLICAGGQSLLVDAPSPLRRVLRDAERASGIALDLDDLDAIFLTHLHGDHCGAIEEIGFYRLFKSTRPAIRLHLHESLAEPLWRQRLSAAMNFHSADRGPMDSLDAYFDVRRFAIDDELDLGVPGLRARVRWTDHMLPCTALKVKWRGRTLGYSADTDFDPALIDWLAECDTIIHEVGPGPGHTDQGKLEALDESITRKMLLTHLPDDFAPEDSPIPALEEGKLYTVRAQRESGVHETGVGAG